MDTQTIDLSKLSASELTQLAKQLQDQGKHKRALEKAEKERKAAERKAAHAAMQAELVEALRPAVETLILHTPFEDSESGLWAGYRTPPGLVKMEVDGEQYSISLSATHIARKAEKKAAAEAQVVEEAKAALAQDDKS